MEAPLRQVWIRDLHRLRGSLAHGRLSARYPSIWTPREHLILATFAFTMILKTRMVDRSIYSLTSIDVDGIDAFEQLCCAEHFAESADDEESKDLPGHRALRDAGMDRLIERWRKQLAPAEIEPDVGNSGRHSV
jgi:hypothetical protein